MKPSNEISQAAHAAYRVGFKASTNVLIFSATVATAIILAAVLHAIMVRPPVVVTTTDGWKCQVAVTPRVALCRIPEETLPRP